MIRLGPPDGVAGSAGEARQGGTSPVGGDRAWYAVHSKPRHEKRVAQRLEAKGFDVFLPLVARTRVYRGRRIEVEVPLFSCYLFTHSAEDRLMDASWTPGVIRILGTEAGRHTPIPDRQIEKIRVALQTDLQIDPHPYLREGQRVRVKHGPLAGLEGILIEKGRRHQLIISVDLIAKSACLAIRADDVEPI